MREIKFRAWHKEKKIMGEVLGIDILHKEIFFSNEDVDCYEHTDFKNIELMQYTGLKDMMEKEIYEGDILFEILGEEYFKVIFENGSYRAENEEYSLDLSEYAHFCEIVGNVYENLELIKEWD
ncbi:YopX family protein [Fusobacterium animalis]|uniref:YopX family protein n=1 Tax=Fusobacterium animalis TaxID=76859 RepID=UPI0030CFF8FE